MYKLSYFNMFSNKARTLFGLGIHPEILLVDCFTFGIGFHPAILPEDAHSFRINPGVGFLVYLLCP